MVVSSMTGFARADGEYADWQWSWETKSVNNKALDVRVRMPSGHDRLELPSRQAASKRFKRGSVNMVLNLAHASMGEDKNKYEVNENLLNQLLAAAKKHSNTGVQNIETLLTIRGVVDKVDEAESETDQAQRHASILKCLDEALDALLLNRQLEGQKLHSILAAQLDEIEDCVRNAASAESLRPELRKQRLQIQLRELLEAEPSVTEDRLAQELAILLIKGDITEELDRLKAHVSSAFDLLSEGGAIGRRLDFLCQELNREANTVCSKSNDNTLTKHGLELKVLIEQFREQVQNVE